MTVSSVKCERCGSSTADGCVEDRYCPLIDVQNRQQLLLADAKARQVDKNLDGSDRRETLLSTDSQERKDTPIYSGVVKYFPLALAEIARLSKTGNDKHNPGQPLHWSRGKSNDHADCVMRHLMEVGTIDPDDGHRHATKLAWRALALLQLELEAAAEQKVA